MLECCHSLFYSLVFHPYWTYIYTLVFCINYCNHSKLIAYVCFLSYCSTAPGNQNVPISPVSRPPNMPLLHRGHQSRITVHGGPIRDRRQTNYNSPGGVPMHSQDTSAVGTTGRFSLFNKLTSKFSRRYASGKTKIAVFCSCLLAS